MNPWEQAWHRAEASGPWPQRLRYVRIFDWQWFAQSVLRSEPAFVHDVVTSLYGGDLMILRRVFSPAAMAALKSSCAEWMASRPTSFHKMVEGCPDFHRVIDLETGRKYAFCGCKHSAYFYRWNDDPLAVWPLVGGPWRIAKEAMGLDPHAYERFTPKDGVVDRVQIVRYPPAIGYLEPHADPHLHQRCFFGAYMSRIGVDYEGGGFYLVGGHDEVIEIEPQLGVGDATLGCATLVHGVAPCDRHKTPDWSATDGRWFLSMYSNASDEVPKRHTGRPVKLNIAGVLP